ncbi:hypothetical protein K0U83_25305 [bacterium]|nr:hypothetical protein [bacterium]
MSESGAVNEGRPAEVGEVTGVELNSVGSVRAGISDPSVSTPESLVTSFSLEQETNATATAIVIIRVGRLLHRPLILHDPTDLLPTMGVGTTSCGRTCNRSRSLAVSGCSGLCSDNSTSAVVIGVVGPCRRRDAARARPVRIGVTSDVLVGVALQPSVLFMTGSNIANDGAAVGVEMGCGLKAEVIVRAEVRSVINEASPLAAVGSIVAVEVAGE